VLVLVERGYRVQAARDGHEASLMFPEFAPDLVVLDMRMPKMSGPNTCEAIRKTSNVPVIMFTSTNDATEVKDAILKGATDFVLKTTGVGELTDRIAYHLDKSIPVEQSVTAKTVSVAPDQKIATTTLVVDPDDQVRATITAILTRLNQNVIEASTAAEAIVRFKQGNPDIVIAERTLPDMDGFNMFKELNAARNNKDLLKLMMSTRLSPEANRKAHFAGITNFLNKPLDSGKVEMMVADCVRKALRVKKQRTGNAA
jgi:DNA-binding response OmpR family regulator